MQPIWQGVLVSCILIGVVMILRRTSGRVEKSTTASKFGLSPGSLFILVLFVGFFSSMLLLMGACPAPP